MSRYSLALMLLAAPALAHGGHDDLALPPEKTCLPEPDYADLPDDIDEGYYPSAGLTITQIKTAMNGFLVETERCNPKEVVSGRLELELSVSCSGRVAQIEAVDAGGVSPDLVSCFEDVLQYTPFPAHDQSEGFEFRYGLYFEFAP
ncbi:MAG: hypothetical protein HN348_35340 [Proteobacteria bacterium]|nr:hypothetical protein [Pseudomonadota bacterium]